MLARSLASLRKSRAYVLRAPYTCRHFPSFMLRAVSLAEACDRPTKHLKTSTNIASSLLSSRSHLCRLLLPRFAWTLPRALWARIVVVERRRFIFVISTFVDRVYVVRRRRVHATRILTRRSLRSATCPLCVFLHAAECLLTGNEVRLM